MLALAACSSVPDAINPVSWYDSIAGDDEVTEAEPAPGAEEDFPNLASVPDEPAQTQSSDDYAAVAEGLQADKENAQYTDEAIRRADDEVEGETPAAATTEQQQVVELEPAPEPEPEPVAEPEPEPEPVTTAQTQNVEQTEQPVPAQPLESAQAAAPAAEPVPAQPLPGTTVAATTTAQATVPAATTTAAATPAASQGSFMDMFNAAYQASAARTLPGSATAAAVVPAVAQPTAATALPTSYAPTARYRGTRPTRLIASIMFADGSARLDSQARKTLLDVAYAYGATGGQILLIGHASGSGGANAELANFDVSLKRAVAVANELMRLQVTPENILVEAVGDNAPQVSLDMAGGAVNRRVDIYLGN